MGAQPSSAAFFKAMSYALQGLGDIVVYCDDLFVHSKNRIDQMAKINDMLHRLATYGLKIAPKKCKFFHHIIPFLGYEISGKGIKPELDKLVHLREMTYPRTNTEIRSFLGFVNFFRKFIPNSSLHAARLTSFTRKNGSWKRGMLDAEAREASNYLKEYLLTAPTLFSPNPDKELFFFTNASKGTPIISGMIGWAVVQKRNAEGV